MSYSNFFSVLNSKIFTNSIPSLKVALIDNSTSMYLVVTNSALSTSIYLVVTNSALSTSIIY